MTEDSSGGGSSGSVDGGYIASIQKLFGGHGAGEGRSAAREARQVSYAMLRLAQQEAAKASKRFRDSLLQTQEFTMRGSPEESPYTPITVRDPLPVGLTTRLTRAQQSVIRAASTSSLRDDRAAQGAVNRAQRQITKYEAKHPDAYSVVHVRRS